MANNDPCYFDELLFQEITPPDPRLGVAEQYYNTCVATGISVTLPMGVWHGHSNGYPITMVFHFVDNQAVVYGSIDETITGIHPITAGHWDDVQLEITFTRQLPDVPSEPTQNYTGYLFTGPEAGQTPTLAGTFTRPDGSVAGWYAIYAPGEIPDRLV